MFSSNTSQVSNDATYIEDVFSTWLYTGNGSTQTITNGIDLAGKGGLTVFKNRSSAVRWDWIDTARGMTFTDSPILSSNTTSAQAAGASNFVRADSAGFSLGTDTNYNEINLSGQNYASWTFRKQPKFFDVVTYTGTGSARTVAHNLGSVPGCIIVKSTSGAGDWWVYHRSTTATQRLQLNDTFAAGSSTMWNNTEPTSTVFSLGSSAAGNDNGVTYVAYLFAHNAGGFGLTGTDNVISCGSFTGNSSLNSINLGFEAQWVLIKNVTTAGYNWVMYDNMRGFADNGSNQKELRPNTSEAEAAGTVTYATATGFAINDANLRINASGNTYIYIAIRRGPMKVPTDGTSVFSPQFQGSGTTATSPTFNAGFVTDMLLRGLRSGGSSAYAALGDRLRGASPYLTTSSTDVETASTTFKYDSMTGFYNPSGSATTDIIGWMFRRAPSFMDVVCYTGNLTQRNINHNLTVIPELFIVKSRSAAAAWYVSYYKSSTQDMEGFLNTTSALTTRDWSNGNFGAASTTTTFSVGPYTDINNSGATYVAYLFATCPGVSKVGSYTGNGSSQTINCGFTGGARFVLIKRTDSTGDWYVWDSARGIVSGNDPYLLLNSTAAEVTNTDYIDTYSAGFEISSTAPAAINASGGSFIYLAIA
jgi:hypothetical protein